MTPRRGNWLSPIIPSPAEGDPHVLVADSWLSPGDQKRVWVYVSGSLGWLEAVQAAERMVAANELEWVRLYSLLYESTGKGPDAWRWAVDVLVALREPSVAVETEAMEL